VGFFFGEIMLTQERLKYLFDYDPLTGIFTRKVRIGIHKPGSIAGSPQNKGYIQMYVDKKNYLAHRLAWLYIYGSFPKIQIDHINRIKTDNRIDNLRDVSNSENQHNIGVRSHNQSGVTGVVWDSRSKKWKAQLIYENKRYNIGTFVNVVDAKAARENKFKEVSLSKQPELH
jgi:hypothetical protein